MSKFPIKNNKVPQYISSLQNNNNSAFTKILNQWQSGDNQTLNASIVSKAPDNHIILQSKYGQLTIPNKFDLKIGDQLYIRLANPGDEITYFINNNTSNAKSDNTQSGINIALIKQDQTISTTKNKARRSNVNDLPSAYTIIKTKNPVPHTIDGYISYLDLTKIVQNTTLLTVLNNARKSNKKYLNDDTDDATHDKSDKTKINNTQIPIKFNTITNHKQLNPSITINGVVSHNTQEQNQLIKTDFCMITTNDTSMQIGQKILLQIININDHSLEDLLTSKMNHFTLNLNENLALMYNIKNSLNIKLSDAQLDISANDLPDQSQYKNIITKLSKDFCIIKNLINDDSQKHNISEDHSLDRRHIIDRIDLSVNEQLQALMVPFYYTNIVQQHYIKKISDDDANSIRFIIDLKLKNNLINIEGIIHLKANSEIIDNFDLNIKSHKDLTNKIQNQITNIFLHHQELTHIKGSLSISRTY